MRYLSEDDLQEIKKCLDGIHECLYDANLGSMDARKRNPILRNANAYLAIIERRLNGKPVEDISVR